MNLKNRGSMKPISGVIITLNEEENIEACIRSLKPVCDEIIVVDSLSSDHTVEFAKKNGAIVYLQKYLGDGPQKALAAEKSTHDWVLSLDADERLEDELVERIKALDLSDSKTAYAFRRRNFVGDHWIKAAGFYPNYVTRLYNKTTSRCLNKKGHARVDAPRVKKIKAHITHYTYTDYSHWMARLNWMSTVTRKANKIRPLASAWGAFVRKFILKGGMFQGMDGLTVTLTSVLRAYMKYTKLNELHEKKIKADAEFQPPKL